MKVELKELTEMLGGPYILGAYEACPWSYYDPDSGITCAAELRMGSAQDELEAEIQMMYDVPPEGTPSMEQIFVMRCTPAGNNQWSVNNLRLRGAPLAEDVYNWQGRACDFFRMVVAALKEERLPDIEELIDEAFYSRDRYADQQGGGGGRAPKINAGDLLGMKKDAGF